MAPVAALLAAAALGLLCEAMLLIALVVVRAPAGGVRALVPGPRDRAGARDAPARGRCRRGWRWRPPCWPAWRAAALALGVGLLYPIYCAAAKAMLTSGKLSAQEVSAELARWRVWHGLRVVLGLGAFLAALRGVRT